MRYLLFVYSVTLLMGFNNNLEASKGIDNSSYISLYPSTLKNIEGFKTFDPLRVLSNHNFSHKDTLYEGMTYGMTWYLVSKYLEEVKEDLNFKTYADLNDLKFKTFKLPKRDLSFWLNSEFINMDLGSDIYPDFMGKYKVPNVELFRDKSVYLPYNLEAAAELAIFLINNVYPDNFKLKYYIPMGNIPWPVWSDPHFASLYLTFDKRFKDLEMDTSIAAFSPYRPLFSVDSYTLWNLYKTFITNTKGSLDFYTSVFIDLDNYIDGEGTRVSGLRLEGVLDTIATATKNEYGAPLKWIVPEAGTKISSSIRNSKYIMDLLSSKFEGDSNSTAQDWVDYTDDIFNFLHNHSGISYAFNALNNPHIIEKIIPCVVNDIFFDYFKEIKGDRVVVKSNDPDIQNAAFRDGDIIYLYVNNLIDKSQTIKLNYPNMEVSIKRMYPGKFKGGIFEEYRSLTLNTDSLLTLNPKESAVLKFNARNYPVEKELNEEIYYSNVAASFLEGSESLSGSISIPQVENLDSVLLRVSYECSSKVNTEIFKYLPEVKLNGHDIIFWDQDSMYLYNSSAEDSFSTCLMAYVPKHYLKEHNEFSFKFPSEEGGCFGSLVLRILK